MCCTFFELPWSHLEGREEEHPSEGRKVRVEDTYHTLNCFLPSQETADRGQ